MGGKRLPRRRKCCLVERECGEITKVDFVHDTVAVGIHALTESFHRLHAMMVV